MSAYRGIRIRVRRTTDNAILYDSGSSVDSVSEFILDADAYAGTVGYVIEAMYLEGTSGGTTVSDMPAPLCRRQSLVALALHK